MQVVGHVTLEDMQSECSLESVPALLALCMFLVLEWQFLVCFGQGLRVR